MAGNDKPLPQESGTEVQDMQLVQALHETRALARTRDDHDGWDELAGTCDRILDRMGAESGSPGLTREMGLDRIARGSFTLDRDTRRRTVAVLMALADQPDERQLDLALDAVRDLEDAL